MFPIFIPSKSRSNTCTTAQLLKKYGLPFTLFIYNDDYDDYLLKFHKDNLFIVPDYVKGITAKRQFMLDYARSNNYEWFFMIDDDIQKIYVRPVGVIGKSLTPLTIKEFVETIYKFIKFIESKNPYHSIYEVGFKERAFGIQKSPVSINTDIGPIHLMNVKNIENINYDSDMIALEDTDFCVRNIKNNKINIKLNHFIFFAPKSGTNKGGLEDIYNQSGKTKGVIQFKEKYDDLIKIDDTNGEKYRINWSKFKQGKESIEKDLVELYNEFF
tara:strand:+ start:1004 stop:1816 length:813 start_codon:yes stop_codon:yes gene_type:complete